MSFVSRIITPERDYNATLSYAEKKGLEKGMEKGLEKGRQLEREKADQEIAKLQARAEQAIAAQQKAEADKQKAEAGKLKSARTLKKSGVGVHIIASSLNLPLDVVEKL